MFSLPISDETTATMVVLTVIGLIVVGLSTFIGMLFVRIFRDKRKADASPIHRAEQNWPLRKAA
jgi:hypothetical protein